MGEEWDKLKWGSKENFISIYSRKPQQLCQIGFWAGYWKRMLSEAEWWKTC